jgi:hypothetical protein
MEWRHANSTRGLLPGDVAVVAWNYTRSRAALGWLIARRTRALWNSLLTLALAVGLILATGSASIPAAVAPFNEYEIKAAFLYNFIKFTEWPAEEIGRSDEPFIIGVLGKDPFGAALDKIIEGETIHNKKVVARRFPRMDEAAANSHVLFISSSEENNLAAILKLLAGQAVLTVSEINNFTQRGGIIHLKKENNRIVFDVDLATAKQAGLSMNAQLLKLAKVVRGNS